MKQTLASSTDESLTKKLANKSSVPDMKVEILVSSSNQRSSSPPAAKEFLDLLSDLWKNAAISEGGKKTRREA